ncbi:FAD-dependent oxidoreductase [Endozoicomonas sp. GU-1]|uniref:NAD(P)/FAD-dependent oxidoreductase n=1 Tax=Endozoicomonas sp. GU-1 TaxID=3009078 RepID=UPI0022B3B461|nr:FAD-dependent oxidoreductase [Endozoicomonas sp. GU-1]WBA80391.1 FAD-dependent oxidoreductase [Endozoicomonas sp. GU-1]WBA87957.1 FAD-dependent oxidoreductase [Endozoicomonas sp. GU-1]
MSQTVEADVVVIGGGIAGLWLFRTLNTLGYRTLLLEQNALGGGQTIKSQGIVHGGTKYTLTGQLTNASQAIAGMPERWRNALVGKGGEVDPDLRSARILSEYHYLWSPGDIGSRLTSFFASKALRGRVDALTSEQFPAIFKHDGFRGKVYQLNEIVLDIATVTRALVSGLEDKTLKVDWSEQGNARLLTNANGEIDAVALADSNGQTTLLQAKRFVLAAGEGAEALLNTWGVSQPKMQVRPLQMVMVRHSYPEPVYAHCLGTTPLPRMTITSHPDIDGKWVWYLGGGIAEDGVKQSAEELIVTAKKELKALLPWVDLSQAEWDTLRVNRAEPKQSRLLRPDAAFCQPVANGIVTWPTKLALAPNLSDEVVRLLQEDNIRPATDNSFVMPEGFSRPEICPNFWQGHFVQGKTL